MKPAHETLAWLLLFAVIAVALPIGVLRVIEMMTGVP